jgi:DNA-directed RNA polymerase specialized sigma24 family protein
VVEEAATRTAADLAPLVERHYPALVRIASFRAANRRDVERLILESVRDAGAARSDEPDLLLFRALIPRVAALERQAPRPEEWGAEPVQALRQSSVERAGSRWEGWFKVEPRAFTALEKRRRTEARRAAAAALSRLPLAQRVVVVLRDVAGWTAEDVGRVLRIEPSVQRALLHGGRSRVRLALEPLAEPRNHA